MNIKKKFNIFNFNIKSVVFDMKLMNFGWLTMIVGFLLMFANNLILSYIFSFLYYISLGLLIVGIFRSLFNIKSVKIYIIIIVVIIIIGLFLTIPHFGFPFLISFCLLAFGALHLLISLIISLFVFLIKFIFKKFKK